MNVPMASGPETNRTASPASPTGRCAAWATSRYPGPVASVDNLTVTVSEDDPSVIVVVGQIDSHTATALDEALDAAPSAASVSVDLSEVSFVDSSGLRVLVRAHKRLADGGGALTLVKPSQPVTRLLDMTGLSSELAITS